MWVWVLLVAAAASSASAGRIVGGDPTTIDQYPSIVQLERYRSNIWSQSCAANILNQYYLVSAAHCLNDDPEVVIATRRIRAGTTYRSSGGVIYTLSSVIVHPDYRVLAPLDADIGLVRLTTYLAYSDVIQPVPIPPQGYELPDNLPVVHAGWGTTTQGGTTSPVLLDVTIYSINRDLCAARYLNRSSIVTENMICAGILDEGGKDACQGDSGGPLYLSGVLIGIVSWGYGCAHERYPGVSARVSSYTEWISSSTLD